MVRKKSPAICINDVLPQHLLSEILIRIPPADVSRCKSVCTLWFCVLELDRDFVGRFLLHRIREPPVDNDEEGRASVHVKWNHGEMVMLTPTAYCRTASQFSLDFLPFVKDRDPSRSRLRFLVMGSSNGLLLLSTSDRWRTGNYYICNPITRHWFKLPPASPRTSCFSVQFGFVSDPIYQINDDRRSVTVNHRFGVKVVRLDFTRYNHDFNVQDVDVELFSSRTGCWTASRVQLPVRGNEKLFDGPTTLDNGKLYWVLEQEFGFLGYDIHKNEFFMNSTTQLLYPHVNDHYQGFGVRLSQCQGSLWVAQLLAGKLRVHSLAGGEWRLEHEVILEEMPCSSSKVLDRSTWEVQEEIGFYAMHPCDPMIGYLAIDNVLLELNFRTRTLAALIELDPDDDWLDSSDFYLLPLSLPVLWPTPLPLLPDA